MSANKPRVVLIGRMYDAEGEDILAQEAQLDALDSPSPEDIKAALENADGAFCRYPNRITRDSLQNAGRLKVISTSGRGTDAIDLQAATDKGIIIVNNPGQGARPVREHTIGLMIALAKNIVTLNASTHTGDGWTTPIKNRGIELNSRNVGLIGLGDVGSAVASLCGPAFQMNVLAYDPYIDDQKAADLGVTRVHDLKSLLSQSDFVSVHAELTDETRGMFDEAVFQQMKPGAFFINTARGPIVQSHALAKALRENWIAGAAIDVYEDEPVLADNPLCGINNLILSPHVGGLTLEAVHELSLSAAKQILQGIRGETPPHVVNV